MKPIVTLIDNYDSFTYNLLQYCAILGATVQVLRNDAIAYNHIPANTTHILISPGPATPTQAGISNAVIRYYAGKIPILGVCLGHQCIGEVFGGKVVRASTLMHGKISRITHDGKGVFQGMDAHALSVVRYHSLVVERQSLPDCLTVSATVEGNLQGDIMALRHKTLPVEGVQFHPEAYYTEAGLKLLENFLYAKP